MEALLFQGILDFLDVGGVAGLHGDTEHAGIHLVAVGRTVVMNSRDVAAQVCNDGGYLYQLARLVVQLHLDGAETSTLYQSTVDDTVEDGYVDVTAAYYEMVFLPFTGTLLYITAATLAAPAPSATIFSLSRSFRMAAQISSSLTVTISST